MKHQSFSRKRVDGLVGRASTSSAGDLGFKFHSRHTSDLKTVFWWLPCQTNGDTASVRGLVGVALVFCDCEIASLVGSFNLSVADRLGDLVVMASISRAEDPRFESRF